MTDAYITHWATVAHSIISGTKIVLLEHCDEVWNASGGFCPPVQNAAAPMTTVFPTCATPNNCASSYHAYQTARLHAIWHSVWGADSARVVASFGTQIGTFSNPAFSLNMTAERFGASSPTTVTFTGTTPVVVNWTGSNMTAGQAVSFSTTGSLPGGLIPAGNVDDFAGFVTSFSNGSATIGWTSHGLLLNQSVYFENSPPSGVLPNNIAPYTRYYVVTTGTNSIQVASSIGGSAIVASGGVPNTAGYIGPQDYYVTNDGSLGANSFHISDTLAHALAGTGTINVSGSASGTTTGYKLLWPNRLGDGNTDAINTAPYFGDQGQLWVDAWSADAGGLTKAFAELTAGLTTGSQIPNCVGENTTAGGTINYTLTSDATWGNGAIPATPVNGQMIQMKMNATNTTNTAHLAVDGGNSYPMQDFKGAAQGANVLTNGNCFVYQSNGLWRCWYAGMAQRSNRTVYWGCYCNGRNILGG